MASGELFKLNSPPSGCTTSVDCKVKKQELNLTVRLTGRDMTSLLFYKNPVALNKTKHKDLKIKSGSSDYSFSEDTNSVILAGVEFTEAAKEYPIVFAEAGEKYVPVALLGVRNKENLFIKDDGGWDARYIPAFIRRYPFVLADSGDAGQKMVGIDGSFDGFDEKDGDPLFEDAEPTAVLKQAIDFLEEYQRQYLRTERFTQRLRDNDLLCSLNAKLDMADGQQFALTDLLAIDEKKLLGLSDDKALEFFKSGELAWVYCHLMSLGNMAGLVDRIAKVTGVTADTPADKKKKETDEKSCGQAKKVN